MSSPLALIGLTYDGTDIQDLDGIWLEITRGLNEPPRVRGKDVKVPHRDFDIPRNRRDDGLTIELEGFVRGSGADEQAQVIDFVAKRAAWQALFDPKRDPAQLVATLEGTVSIALATSAAADDIIDTGAAHGLSAGDRIIFTALTGGTGLATDTAYYVIAANLGAQTLQVSATPGGAAIDFTTDITAGTLVRYGSIVSCLARPLPGQLWARVTPAEANVSLELEAYGRWTAVGS